MCSRMRGHEVVLKLRCALQPGGWERLAARSELVAAKCSVYCL